MQVANSQHYNCHLTSIIIYDTAKGGMWFLACTHSNEKSVITCGKSVRLSECIIAAPSGRIYVKFHVGDVSVEKIQIWLKSCEKFRAL